MKTSVLDFIDSDTLREHLSNQTLEPAIECILIVRSRRCSIEKKLEALKERYDTYSPEDFNKGIYNCREKDFKSALKEYIDSTEKDLDDMYRPDNNHVYNAHDRDNIGFHGTFDSFETAMDEIKNNHSGNEFCIVKAKINEFENVTDITALINEKCEPYDIWNLDNDSIACSLYCSYAWIPHHYAIGDLIRFRFDGTFAVVVDNGRCPLTTTNLDINNMALKCVTFEENEYHSCGGVFIQYDFSILLIELATVAELDKCHKELIRFSHLLKGGITPAEFLEEYGQGIIGSKL